MGDGLQAAEELKAAFGDGVLRLRDAQDHARHHRATAEQVAVEPGQHLVR